MTKKLKKGQIVVITENVWGNIVGSITKILTKVEIFNGDQSCICKNVLENSRINNWWERNPRPATEVEKKAYRKGITNIKDM